MPIDNRTANLNLPLPNQANILIDDVARIISALQLVDVAVASKAASAETIAALAGKATLADIAAAVAALVNSSPATLDTLKELATALGNDANFAATITTALALKAPLSGPTFTGTVSGITAAMVGAPAGSGASSGTNTGDESNLTIKTKLSITTLTGSNTGDQVLPTLSSLGGQAALISNANIKTVEGVSLLGEGNVSVRPEPIIFYSLGVN